MTTDTSATPGPAMLRAALIPTLVVGGAAVAAAGALAGSDGAWGGALGLALVVVFFGLGLLVLLRCAGLDPAATFLVALALYTAKVVLIGGAFLLMEVSGAVRGFADHTALGLTAIACTLAWTVGEMVGAARARQPLYDLRTGRAG